MPVSRADAAFHRQGVYALHALGSAHRVERGLAKLTRGWSAGSGGETDGDSDDGQDARDGHRILQRA